MDAEEYRQRGKEMVDYIVDYLENIRDRKVFPDVKPGYIRSLIPSSPPLEPESWSRIMDDFDRVIMPGLTHWQSPHMHAYYPGLNSYPSLLGEMLADAINCIGFTWASSPVCTELEITVMDWLGKMIGLSQDFLHAESNGRGGGVLQTTSSEATLVSLLAARTEAIRRYKETDDELEDAEINSRLVGYCSDQAHSSVEKAGLIGLVKMRYLESDDSFSLQGHTLKQAVEKDRSKGLIPFFLCATLGTTGACSFDNIQDLGPICKQENIWLHVDAAYAGTAFICPEFRHWLKGVELVDSLAFNPSKWMMVHFDCTAMWVKNSRALHRTFNVEPLYLQHENSGLAVDFMHWQIPLSRRFRSLKLWCVIRNFGITGLQKHVRESVRIGQKFESFLLSDSRFEIPAKRHLGMVVFRLRGDNLLTEKLLKRLNSRGHIHCVPASLKGKYVIRFTITSSKTTVDDILKDWLEIQTVATEVLSDEEKMKPREKLPLAEIKERSELFGSSLLLANSPMSPKIVNGSFVAIFYPDNEENDWTKGWSFLTNIHKGSPARRKLFTKKQFSLDSRLDLVQYCIGIKENKPPLPACKEFSTGTETSPTELSEVSPTLEPECQTRQNRSKSLGENIEEENTSNDRIMSLRHTLQQLITVTEHWLGLLQGTDILSKK